MSVLESSAAGRLDWASFAHGLITTGAILSVGVAVIGLAALITWKHLWGWLWREYITTVDAKRLGVMYIIVALLMLVRSGFDVLLMRLQQATAATPGGSGVVSDAVFQQIFTAHGTIMIFFVAMGLLFGLVNVVLPLQLGSRDVAFPFVNAVSFWMFAAGALLTNLSLGIGAFDAAGWLSYPPLSELRYSPGVGVDYWIWSLEIAGIGSTLSGINFLTTILRKRCPGMTLMRMPMFAWSVLSAMVLVVLAFPVLTVTLALLALDRTIGTHIFTADGGGNLMMYVNLIWAWGHPEVYIVIMPAFGIFSEVVATFSRKMLFGYTSMVWALASITLLSFTVWVHHFFTMGAGADVNAVFGIMTMIIAIPTGVKIFNWLATMFRGRIHFSAALHWFFGFVILFSIGGVAGVMLAMPPADFQLHNSLFLVAHFHTMLVSGVLFGDFAGLIYWFPKIFGFTLPERWWKVSFWLWVSGFIAVFVPMYILGLLGMTRRLSTYPADTGWQGLLIIMGVGAVVIGAGLAVTILSFAQGIRTRREHRDTTGDPWDGRTLEWSVPSPAPVYNFAVIPKVTGRDAFWAWKEAGRPEAPARFEPIVIPANTPHAFFLGAAASIAGFAIIWHIAWLAVLAVAAVWCIVILHTTGDGDHDRTIPASAVARGREHSVPQLDVA